MGFVIRILTLLLATCPFFLIAQENVIPWRADVELKWSDFRGKPNKESIIAAVTASGISYTFNATESDGYYDVEYQVDTFFYPDQSWYQPEMCDDLILSHENLHFDITELFARKMRRIMDQTRFTENVSSEIKDIYKNILDELDAFQDRYDTETNFSRNRSAQLQWNEEIKKALQNTPD